MAFTLPHHLTSSSSSSAATAEVEAPKAAEPAKKPAAKKKDDETLAKAPAVVPLVNAGEPSGHLIEDLTKDGFITDANGWKEQELFNFNPWDPMKEFGGAGNIHDDLQDDAFLTPACP